MHNGTGKCSKKIFGRKSYIFSNEDKMAKHKNTKQLGYGFRQEFQDVLDTQNFIEFLVILWIFCMKLAIFELINKGNLYRKKFGKGFRKLFQNLIGQILAI